MNSILRYLQSTKYKGLVFSSSKKMVVGFYVDVDFAGLWGHDNHQDPIIARSWTGIVVTFS